MTRRRMKYLCFWCEKQVWEEDVHYVWDGSDGINGRVLICQDCWDRKVMGR